MDFQVGYTNRIQMIYLIRLSMIFEIMNRTENARGQKLVKNDHLFTFWLLQAHRLGNFEMFLQKHNPHSIPYRTIYYSPMCDV